MTTQTRALLSIVCGALIAATSASVGGASVSVRDASAGTRVREVVEITAERFIYTPSEIKIKKGVSLEIRLKSDDTDHGFRIVGTQTDVRIPKRNKGVTTVIFEPSEAGRYTFECSHVCGAGHSSMRGTIVVTE